MSVSLALPPTQRDFDVYQRVVIEAVSTRRAAAEFSLSQTRIRQLVHRVSRWLTDNLPPQSDATDAAYLRYAQHIAADRLTFFYSQAMDGWRADHQMKYMNLAIRLALAQSKLPVIPGTLECLAADAIEGPLPIDVACAPPTVEKTVLSREQTCSQSAEIDRAIGDGGPIVADHDPVSPGPSLVPADLPASSPPPRDCSPDSKNDHVVAASQPGQPSVNPTPPSSSAKVPSERSAARRAFLAPAHPAPLTGDLPVTALQISPQQLGFHPTPTRSVSEGSPPTRTITQVRLSRRQRRKLRHAKLKS